jgi:glycosyltransferase involved in cell wall biosynthesis
VASAVGGLPGLLEDGRGVTVPPGDAAALATALIDAAERTWDRQLLRATAEEFAVERAADRYVELYSSMMSKEAK